MQTTIQQRLRMFDGIEIDDVPERFAFECYGLRSLLVTHRSIALPLKTSLPLIVALSELETNSTCTRVITASTSDKRWGAVVSKRMVVCVLAKAFLGLLPIVKDSLPFGNWFDKPPGRQAMNMAAYVTNGEKIKHLLNYFDIMGRMLPIYGDWTIYYILHISLERDLKSVTIEPNTRMGSLQMERGDMFAIANKINNVSVVDFANAKLGGGIFGEGSVQEEVMFVQFPELLYALSLDPGIMYDRETWHIGGVNRFSVAPSYDKYSITFGGIAVDAALRNIPHTVHVIAMDALPESKRKRRFGRDAKQAFHRELLKAISGFTYAKNNNKTVVSGLWGAGVFHNPKEMQLQIQWLAATYAKKNLILVADKKSSAYMEKLKNANPSWRDVYNDTLYRFQEQLDASNA
jgi:hypothetical protein